MTEINQLDSFFNEVSKHKRGSDGTDPFNSLCYLFVSEFNWTYEEILNTPIPFLLQMFSIYAKLQEKQKEESDKLKRKRR